MGNENPYSSRCLGKNSNSNSNSSSSSNNNNTAPEDSYLPKHPT